MGLLALMLLHDSRRAARDVRRRATSSCSTTRTARCGTARRSRRGSRSSTARSPSRRFGPYTLQAAIAAVHAEAASAAATDWRQIVGALRPAAARAEPSPVVELNRAVAVAMRDGAGRRTRARSTRSSRAASSPTTSLAHAARADLCRRLGRTREARAAYERALALTHQGAGAPISRAAAARSCSPPSRSQLRQYRCISR